MAAAAQPHGSRAIELTRLFLEALNARDLDALTKIADEGIELRNPRDGRVLSGRDELGRLVKAARDANVVIVRAGDPEITTSNQVTQVRQPVAEIVGTARVHGTAIFEVKGESIVAFEIDSELLHR
jgi:hypothetical protein